MAKYYKSTTAKSYMYNGKVVPGNRDNGWLALSTEEALSFEQSPIIKSLVKAGGVIVTDREPASMSRDPGAVLNANIRLQVENSELKRKIAELEADAERTLSQNEAAQALASKTKEHEELQEKYAQLEAEAKERIAQLEAKLAAAGKDDE